MRKFCTQSIAAGVGVLVACLGLSAAENSPPPIEKTPQRSEAARNVDAPRDADDKSTARRQIDDASRLIAQMKRDADLLKMLQQAQGVFIAPHYLKAAAVIGTRGGQGVLLIRDGDEWTQPAFYNFGRISVGAQAGAAAGSIVMFLMSPKAVDMFRRQGERDNLSFDADAGLTVINYSAAAQGTPERGDVIVWSDAKGLFAGASVGLNDIRQDSNENRAYYGAQTTPQQIFREAVTNPHADSLRSALPERVATR